MFAPLAYHLMSAETHWHHSVHPGRKAKAATLDTLAATPARRSILAHSPRLAHDATEKRPLSFRDSKPISGRIRRLLLFALSQMNDRKESD